MAPGALTMKSPLRSIALAALVAAACGGSGGPAAPASAPSAAPSPATGPLPVGGLLVASRGSDRVLRFDGSGTAAGVFASDPALVRPVGMTFGPDGNLYVAAGDTERVVRFAGDGGAFLGVFARGAALQSPRNLNF